MVRVAVLVSGGGTNLQALIDAQKAGKLPSGTLALVVASKDGVYALERAERNKIPAVALPRKNYDTDEAYDAAMLAVLQAHQIDVVVLAGFLRVLGTTVLSHFANRIINVHPALIPAFCGKGFYGLHVHEAALARGVKLTGATVHLVNEITDGGPILLQKAMEVLPEDTAETLQRRVMEQCEWQLLPQAVEMVCRQLQTEKENA